MSERAEQGALLRPQFLTISPVSRWLPTAPSIAGRDETVFISGVRGNKSSAGVRRTRRHAPACTDKQSIRARGLKPARAPGNVGSSAPSSGEVLRPRGDRVGN